MTDVLFPQWRDEQLDNRYPFADNATLTNGLVTLANSLFLDAVLYPVGGESRMFLSQIEVSHDSIKITIGDQSRRDIASATFDSVNPPTNVTLADSFGRPAGLLLSAPTRLAAVRAFGVGLHDFQPEQTGFVADVCVPTPAVGVRGFLLDDGTLITGKIYLVGGRGVTLRHRQVGSSSASMGGGTGVTEVIEVHVVGDTLFGSPSAAGVAGNAPKFVRQLTFKYGDESHIITPDEHGDIKISANNTDAEDSILRVRTVAGGIIIEAVGEDLSN